MVGMITTGLTGNPYFGSLAALGSGIGASLWYERYWDFIMQYGPIWDWSKDELLLFYGL